MSAQSKRAQREKLKAQGLVPLEVWVTPDERSERNILKKQGFVSVECWVLPENKQAIKVAEIKLREKMSNPEYLQHLKSFEWYESLPEEEKYPVLQQVFESIAIDFLKKTNTDKAIEFFKHAVEHAKNHNDLDRASLNENAILKLTS